MNLCREQNSQRQVRDFFSQGVEVNTAIHAGILLSCLMGTLNI